MLQWLRCRVPTWLSRKAVRYKTFSELDFETFDHWVARRSQHVAKSLVLEWLANEPLLDHKFSLLDVGCGPGVFPKMVLNHPQLSQRIDYCGVDQSENAVKYCRQAYPTYQFHHRDVLVDGLPSGPFDVVIINEVVEHMPDFQTVVDAIVACGPRIFVLAGFAIEPDHRRDTIRWLRNRQCYMNYYSFQNVHAHLRRLAAGRPILIADLGTQPVQNNRWFPSKTKTVFYMRLAASADQTQPVVETTSVVARTSAA